MCAKKLRIDILSLKNQVLKEPLRISWKVRSRKKNKKKYLKHYKQGDMKKKNQYLCFKEEFSLENTYQ